MGYFERSLQKKQEMEDGLLELMQQIPFHQITVTRLTEHLGISRKCFYHYFSGREACLESLVERMIRDAALYVAKMSVELDYSLEAYICNLQYWKSQEAFLSAICRNELDTLFLHRYVSYSMCEDKVLQERMEMPDVELDEDILFFYASGQISLLLRWCQRGFEPSAEEMARKYMRLLCSPLIRTEEK